jgi:UDP-N-acetylmuramoyl-L-alanyl-D-glutamate--2,6-diaminopimelate ligase
MASAAARWADRIIVTSDNPRSESPADIIEQILEGFSPADRDRVLVQSDRRKAIGEAIRSAEDGDVVVLAGKGHETYQEINGQRSHFDDVEVATEFLAERFGDRRTKEA